ncbi:voltage-gated potassium channel protein [Frateuria sp. MAH-13]|uniref:Voltage-gated potassium channel protein n=1 Tax=Frateuria flava TaxID=2821489 RepID=A0ABS4DMT4_9GAMM|nr:voltage-gated potassium channel protein [Frateuria flava]
MKLVPAQRLRAQWHRLLLKSAARYWFPHAPLALLLALGGLQLLQMDFGTHWPSRAVALFSLDAQLKTRLLPPLLIGGGMLVMALGLLWRSRLAWTMALLLELVGATSLLASGTAGHGWALLAYFGVVTVALLAAWRHFDRSSMAAGTLFAFTSVAMLLAYATFGALYLGGDFRPAIGDLVTALYFAMVTMSTVGYGDITPQTSEAKLFTVSVIVLGVAVFATSLTAVIAPMVSRSLKRIVDRGGSRMKRENHFVVIGNTPLAINTWREMARRGRPVTRLLRESPEAADLHGADLVVGDPSDLNVLREAGAHRAEAVLAMHADDSENAFVVLAVKELAGTARTVAAVNDARHLSRVKLVQPDVVIAPQVLGGELLAMLLSGEPVTPEFVMQRVFQQGADAPSGAHAKG